MAPKLGKGTLRRGIVRGVKTAAVKAASRKPAPASAMSGKAALRRSNAVESLAEGAGSAASSVAGSVDGSLATKSEPEDVTPVKRLKLEHPASPLQLAPAATKTASVRPPSLAEWVSPPKAAGMSPKATEPAAVPPAKAVPAAVPPAAVPPATVAPGAAAAGSPAKAVGSLAGTLAKAVTPGGPHRVSLPLQKWAHCKRVTALHGHGSSARSRTTRLGLRRWRRSRKR